MDPPALCAISHFSTASHLPPNPTPLRLNLLLQLTQSAYQVLDQLARLDPSTPDPEWADTLEAFLTHESPAYINAQVATEVEKRLGEEGREEETEDYDPRHGWISGVAGVRGHTFHTGRRSKAYATIYGVWLSVATKVDRRLTEERREEENEDYDPRHRWISRVAGVRGHTFRSGRRSKAFATRSGIWLSFIADVLILAVIPSILSILFFLDFFDQVVLIVLVIAGLVFLGFWRRSNRRSELEGDIAVLEELRHQGIFRQRLRLLWRARGLRELFPGLAILILGLFAFKGFGLVPDNWKEAFQKVVDDTAESFSPAYPFKNSSKAN
ncbi:hypothetical protein B9479_004515 [Cryptococcus floricola]|uniref:Uncharacterized protein n=1 Tax=Cryptococcus floricola TaxID=2591691 RepID=A0A5D3AWE6_9TREE|nr:hypothetical protein B9479_004515 [Cryptococcus floricola]